MNKYNRSQIMDFSRRGLIIPAEERFYIYTHKNQLIDVQKFKVQNILCDVASNSISKIPSGDTHALDVQCGYLHNVKTSTVVITET
jgi:hypothetical protein